MANKLDNPFSVETPEEMSATEINELYVPVAAAEHLNNTRHAFLHGHRGCGKSMILRRMAPDCQMLLNQCGLQELPFFGVYLSIKKMGLDVVDYELLRNESLGVLFSEHALICHLASALFREILKNIDKELLDNEENRSELSLFVKDHLLYSLDVAGLEKRYFPTLNSSSSMTHTLEAIVNVFDTSYRLQNRYFKTSLTLIDSHLAYDGPLLGFHDFFVPMVECIKKLSFLPSGPVFFFIDDADNLNLLQTKVLNTWVSYRTYSIISFKISTQMRYKTYSTLSGSRIENPHDYSEIFASNVYTGSSKENRYSEWVAEVVIKRLKAYYGTEIDPSSYFPNDAKQEAKITEIATQIRKNWELEGRGSRANDDAYRYARPDYMTLISGNKKGGSNYIYSGFNQLVHISSGIIRLFLEPASKMFAVQQARLSNGKVSSILPSVQNEILRQESDYLLFSDFEKRLVDVSDDDHARRDKMLELRNLVVTMGALFREILVDKTRSERRVFSFAISNSESIKRELQDILDLGVQEGYFYESYIGAKEASGRTKLYVLNRRLAPYFKLDPMGFSGYKFVTCEFLYKALKKPKSLIAQIGSQDIDVLTSQSEQLSLL